MGRPMQLLHSRNAQVRDCAGAANSYFAIKQRHSGTAKEYTKDEDNHGRSRQHQHSETFAVLRTGHIGRGRMGALYPLPAISQDTKRIVGAYTTRAGRSGTEPFHVAERGLHSHIREHLIEIRSFLLP